jgi:Flp pilus assembly protein TadG
MIEPSSRSHRLAGRSRGQAIAEFAVAAPIFFLILFAVIDFGRYVYYVQVLNNAAREGARYAIVHGTNGLPPTGPPDDPSGAAVKTVVRNYAIGVTGLEDASVLNITATWDPDNTRDSKVTVEVTYAYRSLIPLVPIPAIQVEGASTLVINN